MLVQKWERISVTQYDRLSEFLPLPPPGLPKINAVIRDAAAEGAEMLIVAYERLIAGDAMI